MAYKTTRIQWTLHINIVFLSIGKDYEFDRQQLQKITLLKNNHFFFSPPVLPLLVAVYPLDRNNGGRDISPRRCPTGRRVGVKYGPGPDGRKDSATRLYGNANSYIEIPNRGKLDTVASITILTWVYHEGIKGPIVNYRPGPGWGVHLWMIGPRTLFARFVRRDDVFTKAVVVTSRKIRYRAWNYIGATYDYKTGVAKLWVNSRLLVVQSIGRFRLATNYPIRIGARRRDKRYFKGRIFCVQIYSRALNRRQIAAASKTCFKKCKSLCLKFSFPNCLWHLSICPLPLPAIIWQGGINEDKLLDPKNTLKLDPETHPTA